MSQNFHGTLKQYINILFSIEGKLCKATKRKQFLLTYKKTNKYPKSMKLRFHPSLCNHDNKLKDVYNKILHKVLTGIRDEIIKALEKEIRTLEQNVAKNVKISKVKQLEKIINLFRKQ